MTYTKDNIKFLDHPIKGRFQDLTGLTFNRLTVLGYAGQGQKPARLHQWWCECICGNVVLRLGTEIKRGKNRSCGCLRNEICKSTKIAATFTTQPFSAKLKRAWYSIQNRCHNTRYHKYPSYGARGITVCDRWLSSFDYFITDMGEPPTSKHSIERLDNDLGYSPENCIWALPLIQANNTRTNHFLEFNGKRMTIAQWSRELSIPYSCLRARASKGWSDEKVLTYSRFHSVTPPSLIPSA